MFCCGKIGRLRVPGSKVASVDVVVGVRVVEVEVGGGVLSEVRLEVHAGAESDVGVDVEPDDTGTNQTASIPRKSDRPSSSR